MCIRDSSYGKPSSFIDRGIDAEAKITIPPIIKKAVAKINRRSKASLDSLEVMSIIILF